MLSVNKLSLAKWKEGKKIDILKDLSIEISKGRITLLLGKSGSGKTSLLRCLSQLESGYGGKIVYGNQCLKTMGNKQRCRTVGFVQQSYPLFPHLNVLDNCAQPLRLCSSLRGKSLYEEVGRVLNLLGMDKYTSARPHELSGGQQQRVAIARALLLNPSFLFFDEPTSALDPENVELFLEILQKLREENKGIVIASQDKALVERTLDRAYFLEQGRLIEKYDLSEATTPPLESKLKLYLSL